MAKVSQAADLHVVRCSWAASDPLLREYHDTEWGVPDFDSRSLWEQLVLESFQAGLAWITVLRKRQAFRRAFQQFDPVKVAALSETDVERLLQDRDIIRSRAKIEAAIGGARAFLAMRDEGIDFSEWVWRLAGGKPIQNSGSGVTPSPLAELMSKQLKQLGFKFVGPVIVYAWMQASGIVNDHAPDCFRRQYCTSAGETIRSA